MIALVCKEINALLDKEYLDQKHGLVFPATLDIGGKNSVIPLDFGAKEISIDRGVIPDAKYRSLSYFEANAPTRNAHINSMYTGFVSFVLWMNTDKINPDNDHLAEIITRDLETSFKNMRGKTFTGDNQGKIHAVRVNYLHNRNSDILARYTFEKKSLVVAPPYDIIKIDMEVDFSIDCEAVTMNPKVC